MTTDLQSEQSWLREVVLRSVPPDPPASICEWASENVRLIGSGRSEQFNPDITPWTRAIIETGLNPRVRKVTFVKPVQSGGSAAGEVLLAYFCATRNSGDIQYNWENDDKAAERWDKRIERILRACPKVLERWPSERKGKKGVVLFAGFNLTVQGVWQPDNLDSDTITIQLNEEIHSWEPGRLAKAYNRTTAVWNSFILNISNAGKKGDQLDQALQNGSNQEWTVKCPGCGLYHPMRTRWEKEHPELGGLRYDSDGCKRDGMYDYNKLESTIRFQFPCGFEIRDSPTERRALSLSGKYSDPRNTGAHISELSFTLEAVSVDYIPFLKLIQEKHEALRALRYGDPEPWKRYLQERESRFWDPEDRPLIGKIVLTESLKKDREGLKDRAMRGMTVDRQAGSAAKGEVPHNWVVIRDFARNGSSQLVYEGKVGLAEDVEALRERYGVEARFVLIDSGWDATGTYKICAQYGYGAVKGEDREYYLHTLDRGAKVRRIYSPVQWLNPFEGLGANHGLKCISWVRNGKVVFGDYSADPQSKPAIPLLLYSKQGIRNALAYVRASKEIQWLVPGDVSDDYKKHMEAEEQREFRHPRTGEAFYVWVNVTKRNDLFVCECYQILLAMLAGLIGTGSAAEQFTPNATSTQKS